jgi:DNA-binding transcriptional ArsR family regulator
VESERQLNAVFRALGDPTRRKIIALLREAGELRVGDVAEAFSISLNGVSKHLKALEQAGLIERRVVGREHRVRVNWQPLSLAYDWLHFHRHFWSQRLNALAEHLERKGQDR